MTNALPPLCESPAYLIAAAYSAYRSGDRELERTARQRLIKEYGIRLVFGEPTNPAPAEKTQGGTK
jgi:hypothetical protein